MFIMITFKILISSIMFKNKCIIFFSDFEDYLIKFEDYNKRRFINSKKQKWKHDYKNSIKETKMNK